MKKKPYFVLMMLPLILSSCGGGDAGASSPSPSSDPSTSESPASESSSLESSASEAASPEAPISSIPSEGSGLTLFRNSHCYLTGIEEGKGLPLTTYHHEGEGGVPYVRLTDFLGVLENLEKLSSGSLSSGSFGLKEENGHLILTKTKGEEIYDCFDFDTKGNRMTVLPESRRFFDNFTDEHLGDGKITQYTKVDLEKTKRALVKERQVIDFSRYGFKPIKEDGDLYAPFDFFALIFATSHSPLGDARLYYNGRDYYLPYNQGTTSACFSSRLHFRYADPVTVNVLVSGYRNSGLPASLCFAPVEAKQGEKYRFESKVVKTNPIGKNEETPAKLIPDFYARLSLNEDGTGRYLYVDAKTDEPFSLPDIGVRDDKTITYTEDEEAIYFEVTSPGFLDGSVDKSLEQINKGKTFYLEKREREIAEYEFNVLRLQFGEYYGLKKSHPEVHDRLDALLAPYKADLLSEDIGVYSHAMMEFLLRTIDDGHTRVISFPLFGEEELPGDYDFSLHNGYRKSRLLDLRTAYVAGRKYAGIEKGLQIEGNTAYLAFDDFIRDMTDMSKLDKAPNDYVGGNTMAFAKAAMEEVKKHDEVKRVVFDVTCNGGGMVSTIPYLLGIMSEDPFILEFDYYAGQEVETHFNVDLNANGVYGEEEDSYEGEYDFFILTSNMSFSCANAFPGYARAAGSARIVGLRSGGGAASVDNCHTPNGFCFTTSSLDVVATTDKDGRYVENDDGIPLDLKIDPSIWYDRKALGEALDAEFPIAETR